MRFALKQFWKIKAAMFLYFSIYLTIVSDTVTLINRIKCKNA